MGTPFDDAMAQLGAAHQAVSCKPVRLLPWRVPGPRESMTPPGPDPARPACEILGEFTLRPMLDKLQGMRSGTEFTGMTRMSAGLARVWFPAAALAGLPYAVAVGDRITLISEADQPTYEIVRDEATDLADGTYPLVRVPL